MTLSTLKNRILSGKNIRQHLYLNSDHNSLYSLHNLDHSSNKKVKEKFKFEEKKNKKWDNGHNKYFKFSIYKR